MEIGEEERYAAGALFTLALHLTQVEEALVLYCTDLSVCHSSFMTYCTHETAAPSAKGFLGVNASMIPCRWNMGQEAMVLWTQPGGAPLYIAL